VALYFRDDVDAIGPPPGRSGELREEAEHVALRERFKVAPCFFTDLLAELPYTPEEISEALWDLVWAGEVTNDAFAPLRAPRLTLAGAKKAADRSRPGRRFGSRRGAAAGAQPQVQGRWGLTAPLFGGKAAVASGPDSRRVLAELLLERYGIVTREQVLAEGIPGGFSVLYNALGDLETLGVCRRGYFVEGLGGAQFALPGAVERLRSQRDDSEAPPVVLAATDPAQPYGAALPWPKRDDRRSDGSADPHARRPQRVAGAYVVQAGAEPVLYVERGGKGIALLVEDDDPRVRPSLQALAEWVVADRVRKLSLEKVNGAPVVGSDWEDVLTELGFRAGPRKLTLSA
jgi:ATP-dependent Lhr-like helicase